jgi:hypothetical protein
MNRIIWEEATGDRAMGRNAGGLFLDGILNWNIFLCIVAGPGGIDPVSHSICSS